MTIHRVSLLTDMLLNAAVAIAQGWQSRTDHHGRQYWWDPTGAMRDQPLLNHYEPSESWSDGGPIIERERIGIHFEYDPSHQQVWHALTPAKTSRLIQASIGTGETPLIAAMRSFVKRKLGEEIDL